MSDLSNLAIVTLVIYAVTIELSTSENSGNNKGCFYKGEYYTGNWTDGCDFNCTCIQPETGYYKCTTRCPIYRDIPTGCVLQLPPGEECCKQPDCRALTRYHSNTNDGDNNDRNSTKPEGLGSVDNVTENDGGKGCHYKGQYHHSNWTDGCELTCTCNDPVAGSYKCIKRCKEHPDLNPGCELKLPANEECCPEPVCNSTDTQSTDDNTSSDIQTSDKASEQTTHREQEVMVSYETVTVPGPTVTTNTAKLTHRLAVIFSKFGPVNLFAVKKGSGNDSATVGTKRDHVHTKLRPGLDYNPTSTENKGVVEQVLAFGLGGFCSYKGLNYTQDERWYDGCKYTCTCLNAKLGVYKCLDRCPKYNALPVGCVQRRSKRDECCFEPDCRYGSVVRRDKLQDPDWLTSSLHRRKLPPISSLRQMFNKRMESKTTSLRTDKRPFLTRYTYTPAYNNTGFMEGNHTNKHVVKVVNDFHSPKLIFARHFLKGKKSGRYSDITPDIQTEPIVMNTKRFTDYSKPDVDMRNSNILGNGSVKTKTNVSETANTGNVNVNTVKNDKIKPSELNTVTWTRTAVTTGNMHKDILKVKPLNIVTSKPSHRVRLDILKTKQLNSVTLNPSHGVHNDILKTKQLNSVTSNPSHGVHKDILKTKQLNTDAELVLSRLLRILDSKIRNVSKTTVGPNHSRNSVTLTKNISLTTVGLNESRNDATANENIQADINTSKEDSDRHLTDHKQSVNTSENIADASMHNTTLVIEDKSNLQQMYTNASNASTEVDLKPMGEYTTNIQSKSVTNSSKVKWKGDSVNKVALGKVSLVKFETSTQSKGNPHSNLLLRLLELKKNTRHKITTPTPKFTMTAGPVYRTIRTNTGIFRVSSVDGTITPLRKPIVGVLSRMLQSARRRGTFRKESTTTKDGCKYKGQFYTKGELWFDKCDYVCKCNGAGQYTCHGRCPGHKYVPRGCSMLKPNTEACCDILVCKNTQNQNNTPSYKQAYTVG